MTWRRRGDGGFDPGDGDDDGLGHDGEGGLDRDDADGFEDGAAGFDDDGFDRDGFDGDGEGDGWDEPGAGRWPLHWHGLYPHERWMWFERLWHDVCRLRDRYRLAVRSGWWEDEIQVETLAAFAAWCDRYDSGEWDDPPGKLALLYDLERVNALLRDGNDPFDPNRDRIAFARYLLDLGGEPAASD